LTPIGTLVSIIADVPGVEIVKARGLGFGRAVGAFAVGTWQIILT
jgi:hypothetical protein